MRMSTSDDWTVQALTKRFGDGLSLRPYQNRLFNFPTGQQGAQSGSFFADANFPTWATAGNIVYRYNNDLSPYCNVDYTTRNAGNATNGTDGASLDLALPYKNLKSSADANSTHIISGRYVLSAYSQSQGSISLVPPNNTSKVVNFQGSDQTGFILNNDFSNTNNDLDVHFKFGAFIDG